MINRLQKTVQHRSLLMLFLCTLMLCVQLATLNHAVDHPFHHNEKLCSGFLAYEHSSSLLTFSLAVNAIVVATGIIVFILASFSKEAITFCSIRAPPACNTLR